MIATVIFVLAALAAMDLARGSVRAVKDAQDVTVATWLLQKAIVELETKIETEGIEKACEKKREGAFPEPYQNFSYVSYCSEIDFKISETVSALLDESAENDEKANTQNMMQKMVLSTASEYLSKASREIHVEVNWVQGKTPRKIDVTTHLARYDLPLNSAACNGGGRTSTPGGGGS